jgi:protein farnesyltransferase subunit beta
MSILTLSSNPHHLPFSCIYWISSSIMTNRTTVPLPVIQETPSTQLQHQTESEVRPYFVDLATLSPHELANLQEIGYLTKESSDTDDQKRIVLIKNVHAAYVQKVWDLQYQLPAGFVSLDASRPWILYWCLHSHDLLQKNSVSEEDKLRMVSFLQHCFEVTELELDDEEEEKKDPFLQQFSTSPSSSNIIQAGGFGGGPGQLAHAAPTYAAVLALAIIATSCGDDDDTTNSSSSPSQQQALDYLVQIRPKIYAWILALQESESGAYRMHDGGEIDVRASYCLLCVAKLLQLPLQEKIASPQVIEFIRRCQTYEGGLGGTPYNEAHGGYTFCGVAALALVDQLNCLDTDALLGWLARRQCHYEGGFAGRAEKLVDGCYSFWQGGALSIVSAYLEQSSSSNSSTDHDMFMDTNVDIPFYGDAPMLERYILLCAQEPKGGLRDKPSKPRDFYHTCYNLSGLSVVQNCPGENYGHVSNAIGRIHPLYNIRVERVQQLQALLASKIFYIS